MQACGETYTGHTVRRSAPLDSHRPCPYNMTGELLNDPELETEGEIERASGAVREAVGRAKRKAKDGIEEIAEKVDDVEE